MGLLEETVERIVGQDAGWRTKARARLERLIMPQWALGRLMDLAEDLAGMTRSMTPPVVRRTVVVMAGDHGVVAEGVSLYPQEVTPQMVRNFVTGGAGINALAGACGGRVVAVDLGVAGELADLKESPYFMAKRIGPGTANMACGPAMSNADAVACVEAGIEVALALADGTDVFGTGDMGIGNTTPSAAIAAAMTGASVAQVTGRGTGIDDRRLEQKVAVIERALNLNRPDPSNGLDVLAKVGGFEIGGIAGLILGAASLQKPVLVDGFISTAGAMVARAIAPASAEYMIAAHRSAEPGHAAMQAFLGKEPLLDLGLRLGEGTGSALAGPLLEAAASLLTKVRTFEEAAVSGAEE